MNNQTSLSLSKQPDHTEKTIPKCICCEKDLDIYSLKLTVERKIRRVLDLDGIKIRGFSCDVCYDFILAKLMNKRFVESYRGYHIFEKEGQFAHHWEPRYCFASLEGCRSAIDDRFKRAVATVPLRLLSLSFHLNS